MMHKTFFTSTIYMLILLAGCNMSTPISPGELVSAHTHLEGTSNCTKCHTMGKKVSDNKCLDCHTNINMRMETDRGYHASKEVKQKSCVKCHSDHHGKDFEIIHFDTEKFDHELTGYFLEGSHKTLNCRECHQTSFIQDTAVLDRPETYLGLGKDCISCHNDQHKGELGKNCADCHGQSEFSPANGFNHNQADFQLRGQHLKIECEQCHVRDAETSSFHTFSIQNFDLCSDCHIDVHNNKFGNDCAACHNEESFHSIRNLSNFDHQLTGYNLSGKHKQVRCEECHGVEFNASPAHDQCMDCHKDYHRGIFRVNGKTQDCINCHNEDSFSESAYTIQQHNSAGFKLTGAHMATACTECHLKGQNWEFRNIGQQCSDCHEDIHEGFISKSYYSSDCEACHYTAQWNDASFNHTLTGYQLEGAHANLGCRDCHFSSTTGLTGQRFQSLNQECIQCHTDIHAGQFSQNDRIDCLRCHGYQNWQASGFNHDNTNFPLDGKHRDVACKECHKEKQEGSLTFIQYKINSYRCEDCH